MRILLKARGILWVFWLWLWPRKPIGEILESGVDASGRWKLTARIDDDRIWRMLKGEYRPWRLRIANLFRWLFGHPPKPYPKWSGFSVAGKEEVSDD